MKRLLAYTTLALIALALALSLWWRFASSANRGEAAEATEQPVAQVKVGTMRQGKIERTLAAFGTVGATPGGSRVIAFPFECQVLSVNANVGQVVAEGDFLARIEPSADARLALDTSRSVLDAAQRALADVQQRYKLKLATNQELSQDEQAVHDAKLKLESLTSRSAGADGLVKAPTAGIVIKIDAQPGAQIAAGTPLAFLASEDRLEVRLGVEPADAAQVRAGQSVRLAPVTAAGGSSHEEITGTVRLIGHSVDAVTRLVDAIVAPDLSSARRLLVGDYVRGEIVVDKHEALLAPRAAVLPDEGGKQILFTIKSGKAVKHEVETGFDDGRSIEITGSGAPSPGEPVVIEGNHELEDGMAVEIAKEPAGEKEAAP